MAISAEQNLQPFTGNGDVSVWVKNSRVGRKPLSKQASKQTNKQINKDRNKQKYPE